MSETGKEIISSVTGGIAVIGMAARMPGARDYREFWRNLVGGVESVSWLSQDELAASGVLETLYSAPDYVPAAAVLDGFDRFDASFFGYNPSEAVRIDPQQRVFLECVVEAVEDAAIPLDALPESTGVYASASMNGYLFNLTSQPGFIETRDLFPIVIGNDKDYAATRVAYKLNLEGPALTIQTACSSSLVALHLACQGLFAGDCDMALAGGVTVKTPHRVGYIHVKEGILSPDGHCRPFDALAQGTIEGNGAGIVVLKRLEDALAAGDRIRAVIRGSAINNDGSRKVGYTAPRVEGQAKAIRMAQLLADIDPETISYIEAHGTGTHLGDPIEIAGITRAFGMATDKKQFCAIGSVKSNIGHLNAAAGIAGLIKTVLMLENRLIPPTVHYRTPNPKIDFAASPVFVNAELNEWRSDRSPLRAGVSSFGVGGTNVHVVLEEAPLRARNLATERPLLFPLSAKTPPALDAASTRLADDLERMPDTVADIAYTLQLGRAAYAKRRVIAAADAAMATRLLRSGDPRACFNAVPLASTPQVVFCFPGQGTQSLGMARQTWQQWPRFRMIFDALAERLAARGQVDLHRTIFSADASPDAAITLQQTANAQVAIFVVEYALARLWQEWAVTPAAVIGHSIGEYAAACLAGVMAPEDALDLIAERGRLIQSLPPGGMLSISSSNDDVRARLPAGLSLAAVNGDALCVASGPMELVERFEGELLEAGIGCRRLQTSHAFHSSMTEPILEAFRAKAAAVRYAEPTLPFMSSVTGEWLDGAVDWVDYWTHHIRQTVLYGPALRSILQDDQPRILLEVGPSQNLTSLARAMTAGSDRTVAVASWPRPTDNGSDAIHLLGALGQLWCHGYPVNFAVLHDAQSLPSRIPIFTYPFQSKRYWAERLGVPVPSRAAEVAPTQGIADAMAVDTSSPVRQRFERPDLSAAFRAPSNAIERLVVEIWSELLSIHEIGVDDNFFEMGGDSLLATQINARFRQKLAVDLSLRKLIEAQTPAAQSQVILDAFLIALKSDQDAEVADITSAATPDELPAQAIDALLARFLEGGTDAGWAAIPRVSRDRAHFPLSHAQQRQWFLEQLAPGSVHLLPNAMRLTGKLCVSVLERALNQLLSRHESLRTVFKVVEGAPVQIIRPYEPYRLELEDLSGYADAEREARLREIFQREARHPIDITVGPLWRNCLIREHDECHVLVFTLHHIISDGWTANVAFGEIVVLYNAFLAGDDSPLPEPRIQYVDFSSWQKDQFDSDYLAPHIAYWKRQLAGIPDRLRLPTDCPRPSVVSYNGDIVLLEFPSPVVAALRAFCEREGVTPFMVFGAVLFVLLHRLSGETDLCIGSPVAGRRHPDLESVIGLFVNTIVLRCQFEANPTFEQLLAQVKQTTLEAYDHQDLPFERLVDELQIQRLPDRSPIYQLLYVHQESALPGITMTDLAIDLLPVHAGGAQFELSVYFTTLRDRAFLRLEYNTDVFEQTTVAQYGDWLVQLCGELLAQPRQSIGLVCQPIGSQTLPVHLLATFTAQPLQAHLDYWLRKWNLPARLTFAPYAQVFQQMLDPESVARRNCEGVNLFLVRFEDWVQGIEGEVGLHQLEENVEIFIEILRRASREDSTIQLIFVCPPSQRFAAEAGRLQQILEDAVRQVAAGSLRLYVFDDADLGRLCGVEERFDAKADAAGHIPYTPEYFAALGMFLVRALLELGQTDPECVFTNEDLVPNQVGGGGIPVVRVHESGRGIVDALRDATAGHRTMPGAALFASADRRACQAVLEGIPEFGVRLLHDPGQLEHELIRSWAIKALVCP